jgi:hypothetical protein
VASSSPRRRRNSDSRRADALFGYLIPLVVIGLSIADFVPDQKIDKYLIGALLIFGLGSLGYRVDVIIEKYLDSKNRGSSGGGS